MIDGAFDPRDIDLADVYQGERLVARLRRFRDHVRFEYLPDATEPIATGLPLSSSPVSTQSAGALPPFFAGMLPEGRRLTALRSAIKTSADDEFSLLLAVGHDCVGDVSVRPAGAAISELAGQPVLELGSELSSVDFTELFARSVGERPDRTGLPGVQDKVSARRMTLPIAAGNTQISTHILKLTPPEFPFLVENEAFFAAAARQCGIEICDSEVIVDRTGRPGLLVTRFDREMIGKTVVRRGQEDGCQVLGLYPADKYRATSEQVVQGLARHCAAAPVSAFRLLRQLAFAYLTGNGDAHAKNFSILRVGDEWRASPAYDVPSSYPYRDRTMAMSLAAKRDQSIGRADFAALGSAAGIRTQAITVMLDELVNRSDVWISRLGELPFDGRRIHDLGRAIQYRRGRLLGR